MVALGGDFKCKLFLLAPQSFLPLFKPLLVFEQFICQDTDHSDCLKKINNYNYLGIVSKKI